MKTSNAWKIGLMVLPMIGTLASAQVVTRIVQTNDVDRLAAGFGSPIALFQATTVEFTAIPTRNGQPIAIPIGAFGTWEVFASPNTWVMAVTNSIYTTNSMTFTANTLDTSIPAGNYRYVARLFDLSSGTNELIAVIGAGALRVQHTPYGAEAGASPTNGLTFMVNSIVPTGAWINAGVGLVSDFTPTGYNMSVDTEYFDGAYYPRTGNPDGFATTGQLAASTDTNEYALRNKQSVFPADGETAIQVTFINGTNFISYLFTNNQITGEWIANESITDAKLANETISMAKFNTNFFQGDLYRSGNTGFVRGIYGYRVAAITGQHNRVLAINTNNRTLYWVDPLVGSGDMLKSDFSTLFPSSNWVNYATGIRGKAVPALESGFLRYTGSAWDFASSEGIGDMLASIYDTNLNSIVDNAEVSRGLWRIRMLSDPGLSATNAGKVVAVSAQGTNLVLLSLGDLGGGDMMTGDWTSGGFIRNDKLSAIPGSSIANDTITHAKIDSTHKIGAAKLSNDVIKVSTSAGGDIDGVFGSLSVVGLRNKSLPVNLSTNQFLKYNGTNWIMADETASTFQNGLTNNGVMINGVPLTNGTDLIISSITGLTASADSAGVVTKVDPANWRIGTNLTGVTGGAVNNSGIHAPYTNSPASPVTIDAANGWWQVLTATGATTIIMANKPVTNNGASVRLDYRSAHATTINNVEGASSLSLSTSIVNVLLWDSPANRPVTNWIVKKLYP